MSLMKYLHVIRLLNQWQNALTEKGIKLLMSKKRTAAVQDLGPLELPT